MKRFLRMLNIGILVAMLALMPVMTACTATGTSSGSTSASATSTLDKAKVAIYAEKEMVVAAMTQAYKSYKTGSISEANFVKMKDLYSKYRVTQNAAADLIATNEPLFKAGLAWDSAGIESAKAAALSAVSTLLQAAVELKLIK